MKGAAKGSSKGAGKSKQSHAKGAGKQSKVHTDNPGFHGTRQRAVKGRVTGKVIAWKGPFGWIKPDSPIDHPSAHKRGGKIYIDQVDVEQELSGIGAAVTFFVYADEAGLGAERVIPNKSGVKTAPVKKTIEKPKPPSGPPSKGKGKGKVAKKVDDATEQKEFGEPDKSSRATITEAPITGVVQDWRGQIGWIKPDEPLEDEEFQSKTGRRKGMLFAHASDVDGELPLTNASVIFSVYKDERGFGGFEIQVIEQGDGVSKKKAAVDEQPTKVGKKGVVAAKPGLKTVKNHTLKENGKGKGKGKVGGKAKGKGKEQKEKGPSGPDLERERVSQSVMTGEVVAFRGRIGWIMPSDELTFDKAEKHGGKLYTHIQDVLEADTEPLKKGDSVQFHVYSDVSGLGAEEVVRV